MRPSVTLGLLLLNLAMFAVQVVLRGADPVAAEGLFERWGLVAADVRAIGKQDPAILATLVTSTFLHAGWLHLLANLLYLAVFGASVEGVLGAGRFLALYLVSGIAGGAVHVLAQPDSLVPAVGASAAVAGVMAAHIVLFPGATIGSLTPVLFRQSVANVSALVLLLVWLAAQVLVGMLAGVTSTPPLLAWWAHLGGFACGLILGTFLRPPRRRW